jgi:two-component system cell cycle sensor histidine kinase/response regulator CckA
MKSQTAMKKILIVEDEAVVALDLRQQLAKLGYDPVAVAHTGEEALVLAGHLRPDLVLMDIKLPGEMDGIRVAQTLRERFAVPVVYLTAYSDQDLVQRTKLTEPYGYVIKPFVVSELGIVIEMALYKHQMEVVLRESEARHRMILHSAMDGFWQVDMQGRLLEVNAAYCRMSGYSEQELLTLRISDLEAVETPVDTVARIQKIISGNDRFESLHRRKDGSIFDVEVSVQYKPANGGQLIAFLRDLSERRQALQELNKQRHKLYHLERVQVMGEIATSLAHEINQPLAGILFSAQAAQQFLEHTKPDLARIRSILADIVADSKRAGEVVSGMRAMLRKEVQEPGVLDVNGVVDKTIAFLRKSLSLHDVAIRFEATAGLPSVRAIGAQVEQVIVNLLMNAEQAMGELRIGDCGLRNGDSPAMIVVSTGRDASGQVTISIRDQGPGFAAAELDRLFEPFHSTKLNGLGMGLSICSSIVKAHGGRIWAENHPDGGAVVTFTLPTAEGEKIADCGMGKAECGMGNAECGMRNAECRLRIARPPILNP